MATNTKPDEIKSQSESITLPGMVYGFLKRIQQNLSVLTITIPGSDVKYSSFLLEIHPEDDFMVLDEFLPDSAAAAMQQAKRLIISAFHDGAQIRFESELMTIGEQKGIPYYVVSLPQRIYYLQKRAFFRVPLSASQDIPAIICDENGYRLEGRVRNISYEGINIGLRKTADTHLLEGTLIDDCKISFPATSINCQLVVQHISNNHLDRSTLVGGRFTNLDQGQKQVIKQLVSSLEREYLRKIRQADND